MVLFHHFYLPKKISFFFRVRYVESSSSDHTLMRQKQRCTCIQAGYRSRSMRCIFHVPVDLIVARWFSYCCARNDKNWRCIFHIPCSGIHRTTAPRGGYFFSFRSIFQSSMYVYGIQNGREFSNETQRHRPPVCRVAFFGTGAG